MSKVMKRRVTDFRKRVDLYFSSPLFLLLLVAAFMLM
jgi:ABC-type microcin C transport system permease subunit YejE